MCLSVFLMTGPSTVFAGTVSLNLMRGDRLETVDNVRLSKSKHPVTFPKSEHLSMTQMQLVDSVRVLLEKHHAHNLAFLVIENGDLLYQHYGAGISPKTPLYSMSMSKSLTSYTFGGALCDGRIQDVHHPSQIYAPRINGTVYGEATLHNNLRMATGAPAPQFHGASYKGQFKDLREHKVSQLDIMLRFAEKAAPQGQDFVYLSNSTSAVSEAIGNNFVEDFNKLIWQKIGAEADGYWLLDKDGRALSSAGFYAVATDWGRLARFIMQRALDGNDCMSQWFRTVHKPQIKNRGRQGQFRITFPDYGYQVWLRKKQIWWHGFGGQRIAIDLEKRRIFVVFSQDPDPEYLNAILQAFDR